jgi:histidinol phosphatase-like enzyme
MNKAIFLDRDGPINEDSGDSIEFYRVIKTGDKGTEREWKNLKKGVG